MENMMSQWLEKTNCPKCGVKPDSFHEPGCDFERCACCGEQYACNEIAARWEGYYPGTREAIKYDFWCKPGNGWEECDRNDPEARPDLNKLHALAKWDKNKQEYFIPKCKKHSLK
jgi:hypothetical protein